MNLAKVHSVLVTFSTDNELPPGATWKDLAETLTDRLEDFTGGASIDVRPQFRLGHVEVTACDEHGYWIGMDTDDYLRSVAGAVIDAWWEDAYRAAE
jgi:hypothetical protein